jgi:signal transduction histidine kinase
VSAVLAYLPRGNTLSDEEWHRRHRLLQWVLAAHIPGLFVFGVLRHFAAADVAETLALPLACLIVGHLLQSRRLASAFVTLGLVYCSAALVGFSDGAIEAHFHFFIMIGFIALYQDWIPFLLNILFTVLSHGIGSSFVPDLMFNHTSAQEHPWEWSLIHGVAVLAACVGVVLFWKTTEDEQVRSLQLTQELADAEIGRRRFTSDLLVNLARRNQNLLYRQLDLLNDLEDKERDPDALADLFRLDHLATRIRRNAESLLVLSGEESPRIWREPVALVDVVRAAIAEIEDLDRVDDAIDETLSVSGRSVADLTHLFAELLENAVHFSPPGVTVVVRSRPLPSSPGTRLVTIEDWGVGMTAQEVAEANDTLRAPREVDLSVSQRLGLHVVARLAQRYGISVELTPTPGGGVTAVVLLPPVVFERSAVLVGATAAPANGGYGGGFSTPRGAVPAGGFGTPPGGTPAGGFGTPPPAAMPTGRPVVNGAVNGNGAVAPARPLPAGPVPSIPVQTGSAGGAAPGGPVQTGPASGPVPMGSPVPPALPTGPASGPVQTGPASGSVQVGPASGPVQVGPASGPVQTGAAGGPVPMGVSTGPAGARPARPGTAPNGGPPPTTATNGLSAAGTATPVRPPAPPRAIPPRPTPPLPPTQPAPAGDPGLQLPRRGPGEALNRSRLARPGDGPAGDLPAAPRERMTQLPAPFQAPATAGGDGAAQPGGETDDSWSSWWSRTTPGAGGEPRPEPDRPTPQNGNGPPDPDPDPLPEPRPPADDEPQLRRRVPQANLAAGLRRETEAAAAEETPVVRDPMTARNALSRFQAAQRAARSQVDGDQPEGGPAR